MSWSMFLNICVRIFYIALGLYLMWDEGQHQPQPGIWFFIGMMLIAFAFLIPSEVFTSDK